MKRNLSAAIVILFFSLFFASCGSTKVESADKKSDKKQAPSIVLKDFFIADNSAEYSEKIKKVTNIKSPMALPVASGA